MMRILRLVKDMHPEYETIVDAVAHIYSAEEFDAETGLNRRRVICYRTKDGVTHQSYIVDGECIRMVSK